MIISGLVFEFEKEDENIKYFNFSSGVIFHSIFLDFVKKINEDYLNILHSKNNAQRAYRIKIPRIENKNIKWSIYGLNKNMFELFQGIQSASNQNIHIKHYNSTFKTKRPSTKS